MGISAGMAVVEMKKANKLGCILEGDFFIGLSD